MERVCAIDRLFHHFIAGKAGDGQHEAASRIIANGLRPLSDVPDSERWQQLQAALPGFYELLYRYVAEPVLKRPYTNSGVFLTPIDFRKLPGSLLHGRPRFAIPLDAVDPSSSVLTWEWADERVSHPLSPETLEEAARFWTAQRVGEWFGRDPHRLFYYVPQVAVYQEGGIPVRAEWWEPA